MASIRPLLFPFSADFLFFFYSLLFVSLSKIEKIRIALAISNVFRVQKSHPLRVNVRLNILSLIIIVCPYEDNCM